MDIDDITAEGRAIGFDYAAYGLQQPDSSSPSIAEGYREGRAQKHRRLQTTPFIRKWLQLRSNAFRRSRVVQKSITADYLEAIYNPICPISYVPMTRATGQEMDWSVDRLDNNGAYAHGNLIFLSTRVNTAKGSKTIDEVIQLSHEPEISDGLMPKEWARLASLMQGPVGLERGAALNLPQVAPLRRWVIRNSRQDIQDLFALSASDERSREHVSARYRNAYRHKPGALKLKSLMGYLKMASRKIPYPHDVWFSKDLQQPFEDWWSSYPPEGQQLLRMATLEIYKGKEVTAEGIKEFSFESKGYFSNID